jgi:predicted Zn-dependent peptidase
MTVIVVGDATHDELLRSADRAFGGAAPRSGTPAPAAALVGAPPAPASSARVVLVPRDGAPQSELRIGRVAASRDTPDYHPLVVLNTVLGGQFVSRINLNLREDKGYTYGARSGFEFRRGPGPFVVAASVQTDATAAAVREVLGELSAIRSDRPPEARELDRAKAALTRGYARGFETAEQVARAVTQLVVYGLDDDYYDRFIERTEAVDGASVVRGALDWLDPAAMAVVIVGDRAEVEAPLEALDLGPVSIGEA